MLESKSSALPTWRHPIMAHLRGVEPLTHGLEVRCSIQLSYRCIYGAGEGNRTLATSLEGWGSTTELHPHRFNFYILSISNVHVKVFFIKILVEESGFEPLKAQLTDLQSVPFSQLGNSSIYIFVELMRGLEPPTY